MKKTDPYQVLKVKRLVFLRLFLQFLPSRTNVPPAPPPLTPLGVCSSNIDGNINRINGRKYHSMEQFMVWLELFYSNLSTMSIYEYNLPFKTACWRIIWLPYVIRKWVTICWELIGYFWWPWLSFRESVETHKYQNQLKISFIKQKSNLTSTSFSTPHTTAHWDWATINYS